MWTRSCWVAAVLQIVGGCSSDDGGAKKVSVGSYCNSDSECSGGFCLAGGCSKHCAEDSECAADSVFVSRVCGVDPKGERSCVPDCDTSQGYVCLDGISTSCDVAPGDQCAKCGCPGSQRCEPSVGCMPKRAAGEPCLSDDDCNTDNCSNFAGVCRVPVGSACGADNCDVCLSSDGWSYCSRECHGNYECGGGLCLGSSDLYYCRPPCAGILDDSCPGGACKIFIDNLSHAQFYHCDCANSQACKWLEAAHPLGGSCRNDSDCESGLCDRVVTSSDGFSGYAYQGVCSKPCQASDECGSGFACAAVGAAHCLPACEDECDVGSCVGLPTADGASASVCWVKRAEGQCWEPSDCQSGNCAGGSCAPAGGQANGASCDANADCRSKSCIGGACRGTALLGDACAAPADCAAGTCCASGGLAGTCATVCD